MICHEKSVHSITNFYPLRLEEEKEALPKALVKVKQIAMLSSFLFDQNIQGWLIHIQTIHKGKFCFRGLSKYHSIKTRLSVKPLFTDLGFLSMRTSYLSYLKGNRG